MQTVMARAKEPSSFAGIAALLAAFGATSGEAHAVTIALAALASIVAVVAPERNGK